MYASMSFMSIYCTLTEGNKTADDWKDGWNGLGSVNVLIEPDKKQRHFKCAESQTLSRYFGSRNHNLRSKKKSQL